MDKKYKILIPNILTTTRIVFTPIIMILGLTNNYLLMVIFTIIGSVTDLFDGFLARKWNTTSKTGAKLDAVADKVFAIGIVSGLVTKFDILIYILILEIILALSNLFYHYKTNKTESLFIGKVKTTFLFITIICCLLSLIIKNLGAIIIGFSYVTINLQILSVIAYCVNFYKNIKNKPSINDNLMHKEIMTNDKYKDNEIFKDIDDTIVIPKIDNLENSIYDFEDI